MDLTALLQAALMGNPQNMAGGLPGSPVMRGGAPAMRPGMVSDPFAGLPTIPDTSGLESRRSELSRGMFSPPPESRAPVGKNDLLPLLLALGGALAFGVDNDEINAGATSYLGAKNAQAERLTADDMRRYQMGREKNAFEIEGIDRELANARRTQDYVQGRKDKIGDDIRNFDQAKALEADKQKGLTERANIRNPQSVEFWKSMAKRPDGMAYMANAVTNGDVNAIEAARSLSMAEKNTASQTAERDAMLPGKLESQGLKNEYQRIMNEFLPASLKGKIQLTADQSEWLQTKIKNYPAFLQATMARVEIARSLANSQIYDRTFNQGMDTWKAKNSPALDALEKELNIHLKEVAALEGRGDPLGLGAFDEVAKQVRIEKLNKRILDIQQRMTDLTGSMPSTFESFETVPNGRPSTSQTPLGGTLPGVRNPKTGQPSGVKTGSGPTPKKDVKPKAGSKLSGSGFKIGG